MEKPQKSTVSSDQCSGVANSCAILRFLMVMTSKAAIWDVTVRSFADTDVSKQSDVFMTTQMMEMNETIYRTHTASHYKDNYYLHIHRRQNFVPD